MSDKWQGQPNAAKGRTLSALVGHDSTGGMKEERLTLRLDAELKQLLQVRADAEERTMSKVAERILREALTGKAKRAR